MEKWTLDVEFLEDCRLIYWLSLCSYDSIFSNLMEIIFQAQDVNVKMNITIAGSSSSKALEKINKLEKSLMVKMRYLLIVFISYKFVAHIAYGINWKRILPTVLLQYIDIIKSKKYNYYKRFLPLSFLLSKKCNRICEQGYLFKDSKILL